MALTTAGKFILSGLAIGGILFGGHEAMVKGWIRTPGLLKSVVTVSAKLPDYKDATADPNVKPVAMPTSNPISDKPTIRIGVWEWNGYSAAFYANGGPLTTIGSLNDKFGVHVQYIRIDSNDQMDAELVSCAQELTTGMDYCDKGVEAIIIMGDSAGQWAANLDPKLSTIGKIKGAYNIEIVDAVGRSNGEDALLGPAEWKKNPRSMLGKTVVGVILDGDWNILMNYLGANNLKYNPDTKTYDANAVNIMAAPENDYIKAVTDAFIPNRCELRIIVSEGKPTGEGKKTVCPDGVVTWTPGDEQAVQGRPIIDDDNVGIEHQPIAKIISSAQYKSQMPATMIGLTKFFSDHRQEIEGFIAAASLAGDQLKAFPQALAKAGMISADIYQDKDGAYWTKYFNGFTDPSTGVPLGGSAVFNMADRVAYFNLDGSHNNNMKATYEQFAKIDVNSYPENFAKNPIPPYGRGVVDTTFISGAQQLLDSNGDTQTEGKAEQTNYTEEKSDGIVLGKKPVYINFALNSDQPLPSSIPALADLKDQLAINSGLAIQIDGYTDNTGSDTRNIPLSAARAMAIKKYLQRVAPSSFPEERFKSVQGHGSQDPIASNATPQGQAQNRRVVISQIGQ